MTTYSKTEIAKLLGKPERTVQYYLAFGLVDKPEGSRRGKTMKFSKHDALAFGMAEILLKDGHTLETIKQVLHELRVGQAEFWHKNKRGIVPLVDFFSSYDWGKTKELFLIEHAGTYELHVFPIVSQDTEKYGSFDAMNRAIAKAVAPKKVTTLKLIVMSKVKQKAMRLMKIK